MWRKLNAEGGRPGQPGVVQHPEVISVVGDQYPVGADSGQQHCIISQCVGADIARQDDAMPARLEQRPNVARDVVVEMQEPQR